jgi:hypothetical protein
MNVPAISISNISDRLCMSFFYDMFWHYDMAQHHMILMTLSDFADSISLYIRAARLLYSKHLSQAIYR